MREKGTHLYSFMRIKIVFLHSEVREFALQIILAVMLGILTVLFYHVGILKKICEAHQSLHDYCIDFSNSSDDVFVIELLIDESKLLHVARILPFIDDGL